MHLKDIIRGGRMMMKKKKYLLGSVIFCFGIVLTVLLCTFQPHGNETKNKVTKNESTNDKIQTTYMNASWERGYSSMKELVESSDLIAHVRILDDGKVSEGKMNTLHYASSVEHSLYGCEKGDVIDLQMTGHRDERKSIDE